MSKEQMILNQVRTFFGGEEFQTIELCESLLESELIQETSGISAALNNLISGGFLARGGRGGYILIDSGKRNWVHFSKLTTPVSFSCPVSIIAILDDMSKENQMSRSHVVRMLVREALVQRGQIDDMQ